MLKDGKRKNVAVVIPAFNEADSITGVVDAVNKLRIDGYDLKAVVVNDASLDETGSVAANLQCVLLNLPVNLGIGGAVQTGFKYAWENGFDYVVQVDGDGQHPPGEIHKLIEKMEETQADVVIGSRFMNKTGYQSSQLRRIGIKHFSFLIKLLCHQKIFDTTSGFRLINKKTLSIVQACYPDEYPEPESLILFALKGLKVKEVPVEMISRLQGKSSIRAFNTLYYMIKVSFAVCFTYLRYQKI